MEDPQFEHILRFPPFDPPPGFGAIYRPGDEIGHRTLPGTPGEGQNAEEPIMIGSSDEESGDDDPVMIAVRRQDPRRTLGELRARLLNNRYGTPIPRAREDGLRIMSPPPAVPPLPLHAHFHRRADWPHPHPHSHHHAIQAIQQRLIGSNIRNDIFQQLVGPDRVGRLLGMMFGPNEYGAGAGGAEGLGARQVEEYDTRMTHARAKPRIGFTYDFAPDEEDEDQVRKPAVRTRTTIIIPDSPPTRPVDRKGKGRAIDEVLDLESDEWNQDVGASTSASGSASGSTVASPPRKKRKTAVEVVEVLSDDELEILEEEEEEAKAESKVQTILVCAGCRRPLRMGGDRLWALRCGHMIDSRCYRQLGERPIVPEDIPVLPEPEPELVATTMTTTSTSTSGRGKKKRRGGGGGGKSRAKSKAAPLAAPPPAPVPYVAETIEWTCPVFKCGRVHWSERVVTSGTSAWQPMKDTGAVGVFV
ncbi:hypothetical protein FRC09_009079 [Ceratobasidium sp. 395]|nr:hypothetical protein FRC09_009079 [Ceratobasidium sp. 395]